MSEKEEKSPKGLEELGKIFSLDFNIIDEFLLDSSVKKLQEILNEEIRVSGILFSMPKSKKVIFLLASPEDKDKTMLLSTPDEEPEKIYEALSKLKKR